MPVIACIPRGHSKGSRIDKLMNQSRCFISWQSSDDFYRSAFCGPVIYVRGMPWGQCEVLNNVGVLIPLDILLVQSLKGIVADEYVKQFPKPVRMVALEREYI